VEKRGLPYKPEWLGIGNSKALVAMSFLPAQPRQWQVRSQLGDMESETLRQQATSNTKEQFGNSPDLSSELMNAVMDAQEAHTTMSTKMLNSAAVLAGIKDILLNNSRLYETLRGQGGADGRPTYPG
jgi:hypothetical protein